MRGDDQQSGHLFSYLSPEQRMPAAHPLRVILQMTDEALLSPQFEAIYATTGRPSVPPEQLLRALLLQALLHRAERAAAGGTVGVQPVVPLVRGLGDG
jgi:hypothetical protein